VLDIGCGMGVSILGLSSLVKKGMLEDDGPIGISWNDCNFAGVDLSSLGINYARSLSQMWSLNAHFRLDSAENALRSIIHTYPGPINLCMIQFPTPYRLLEPSYMEKPLGGNSQLPSNPHDGFMVTEELLHLIYRALTSGGKLLLQSNCEDVALWMKHLAVTRCQFQVCYWDTSTPISKDCTSSKCITSTNSIQSQHKTDRLEQTASAHPTKRTMNWIALRESNNDNDDQAQYRAIGSEWSRKSLLPPHPTMGRTETEVACIRNQVPIHRCLLIKV
jgi:SAM-dependent methyltransferase